nr:MAG TPA: Minor capsid protein [Caudoviricetes sp.]
MITNNDFQIVLCNYVNTLDLGLNARIDYFNEKDDLVINLISGGRVEQLFMDGSQEISLPYEIAVKSKDNQRANAIIWTIHSYLSQFGIQLPSQNNSYQFLEMEIAKPSINGQDEQGFFIYTLNITAKLEIKGDNN